MEIEITVNGVKYQLTVHAKERLLDVLRLQLGLTGAKEGCGEGECGACTVLLEGVAVNSCLVLAFQARGKEVITVEGLGGHENLSRLQQAFVEENAVQCGYCTSGMLMAAKALLLRNSNPSEAEIRQALAGNLCRCTGYTNIIKAVKTAAISEQK
jgi:aerobic carbon-monoxide dehydrogenase small subunit